ncbi:MAG TPA: carboxypeptidase-like regulatory domain-containing protein, partial [Candidatus Acidoferrales bacterium]|nr:carboxypeptidase-like regulatory domain-containing protein [Candidatus Acidoferrales bacterium]
MKPRALARSFRAVVLSTSVLLCVTSLIAQTVTGTLHGQVTDPSGAAVPNATVVVTSDSGQAAMVRSSRDGAYEVKGLSPGNYTVKADAKGFQEYSSDKIQVTAGQSQKLDLPLVIEGEHQKIEVQSEGGAQLSVSPENNASAVVISGKDLDELSDDPDQLQSDLAALAGPSVGPSGGQMYIDGFTAGQLPPKSSIREIRINQNPFSAEYDKLGYGRIEIFTKPGTDHYRGTLDYNYANDIWNSRNPYSAEKAPLLLNEIEGNMAGPINQRTSFTFDGQRNMVDNGAIINAVTLNPQTLAIQPYFSIYTVPQVLTRASPRIDYRLNDNNTLIVRYSITQSDINGAGIGTFDLATRGYDYGYLNQTVQATETAVLGSSINETRFQY